MAFITSAARASLPSSERNPCDLELRRELMEYRARDKDNELKRQLLKELILKYSQAERELLELNRKLTEKQHRLHQNLEAAAEIQKSLLPRHLSAIASLEISWKFLPCELIGGDIFNVVPLDDDHVGLYIIDVSGHGVPSALVTVSVSQALQPQSGYLMKTSEASVAHEIMSPTHVLSALDAEFPMERFDMFFTMIYAVFNTRNGSFVYSRAGHPPAILLRRDGTFEFLQTGGPAVGCGWLGPFEEEQRELTRGDRLILYSDGITEYENAPGGDFYGSSRLRTFVEAHREEPLPVLLDGLMASLLDFGDYGMPQDDISLLGIEYKG